MARAGFGTGLEPGPGDVGPGAAVGSRCANRGGGGEGEHRMGLGNRSPHAGRGLAVALAEQLVRLGGEFLGAAEVLWSGYLGLQRSRCPVSK